MSEQSPKTPEEVDRENLEIRQKHIEVEKNHAASLAEFGKALERSDWDGDTDVEAALGEEDETFENSTRTGIHATDVRDEAEQFYAEHTDTLHDLANAENAQRTSEIDAQNQALYKEHVDAETKKDSAEWKLGTQYDRASYITGDLDPDSDEIKEDIDYAEQARDEAAEAAQRVVDDSKKFYEAHKDTLHGIAIDEDQERTQ